MSRCAATVCLVLTDEPNNEVVMRSLPVINLQLKAQGEIRVTSSTTTPKIHADVSTGQVKINPRRVRATMTIAKTEAMRKSRMATAPRVAKMMKAMEMKAIVLTVKKMMATPKAETLKAVEVTMATSIVPTVVHMLHKRLLKSMLESNHSAWQIEGMVQA